MEARDLRLGNLIKRRSADGEIVVDLDVLKKVQRMGWLYSGIPLTEDWLVKFGFKSDYDKSLPYQKAYFKDGCIIFSEKMQIIIEGREGDLHTLGKELKHVHQLQNLYFALTGEEVSYKIEV